MSGGTSAPIPPGTNPRILVVASNFPPAGGGGIQRTVALVRHLAERGWTVAVVTRPSGHTFLPEDDHFANRIPPGVEVHEARGVRWNLPFRAFARLGMPGLAGALTRFFAFPDTNLGWIRPAAAAGRAALGVRPADVVYATAPEHSGHWAGRAIARSLGLPLVLDFRDDFVGNPMVPIPTGLHRGLFRRLERRLLSGAVRAVFNTPEMEADYRARYPDLATRFTHVPNGFEPEDLGGAPSAPPRRGGPCRLLYSGSLYGERSIAPVLDALAAALRERRIAADDVRLDLCGMHWTGDLPLPAPLSGLLRLHGFVRRERLLDLYGEADILLSCEDPVRTTAVPGKLYEHLAVGKRLLFVGAPQGAVANLLREAGVGEAVHPADTDGLRRSLVTAVGEVLQGIPPVRAPLTFLERYRRRALSERLESVLREAIAQGPATR